MNSSDIESTILLRNNSPIDDFCGLTPSEVHHLLYDPFGNKSPLQFRDDIDNTTLDRVPFFSVAEKFVKLVQRDKQIKLTKIGAIPIKVMLELYAHKFFPDEMIEKGRKKLLKEENSIPISSARLTAGVAGLVKKSGGKLSVTKNGTKLLRPENRLQLFKTIFFAYTTDFKWSLNDYYPEHPIGQVGFGFSLYLFDQFGDKEQTTSFYADKYLKAFPKFLSYFPNEIHSTGIENFRHCYKLRTVDHFFDWFGLASIERNKNFFARVDDKLMRTDLFKLLFLFD